MPYQYDVFLSYSHDFPFGEWVKDPFLPIFRGYLKADLGREPQVFIDDTIRVGHSWSEKLKNALASSRCLVGIWSPNYFQSEWCQYECLVMMNRERKLKYRTKDKPNGLVIPVSVHDGESFPEYARAVQYMNWVDFARIGDGFKKTERYVEFQDQMSRFTKDVAEAVNNSPEWAIEWLDDEWLDGANRQGQNGAGALNGLPASFKAPTLVAT